MRAGLVLVSVSGVWVSVMFPEFDNSIRCC